MPPDYFRWVPRAPRALPAQVPIGCAPQPVECQQFTMWNAEEDATAQWAEIVDAVERETLRRVDVDPESAEGKRHRGRAGEPRWVKVPVVVEKRGNRPKPCPVGACWRWIEGKLREVGVLSGKVNAGVAQPSQLRQLEALRKCCLRRRALLKPLW